MKRWVLDASALVAFFEDAPGGAGVEELIAEAAAGGAELLMSAVNWGEVYYSRWQQSGRRAAQVALAEMAQLPIEVIAAGPEQAKLAAETKALYGLPYADAFAAALAKTAEATVLTRDPDFRRVRRFVDVSFLRPPA